MPGCVSPVAHIYTQKNSLKWGLVARAWQMESGDLLSSVLPGNRAALPQDKTELENSLCRLASSISYYCGESVLATAHGGQSSFMELALFNLYIGFGDQAWSAKVEWQVSALPPENPVCEGANDGCR